MFLGSVNCKLDSKKRLSVPSRFQTKLGDDFVLFKSPEHCLSVYDEATFEEMMAEVIANRPNTPEGSRQARNFFESSAAIKTDGDNRFTVPDSFIEYAGLTCEVEMVGMGGHIEIWPLEAFEARNAERAASESVDLPVINYR